MTSDLKWDSNTNKIVKSANARMQILREISSFGASLSDMKIIYFLFINSLLEQSSEVWHSSLTKENIQDLERVQKSALRIILKNRYKSYKNALNILEIDKLSDRREKLCLQFAKKCLKHPKLKQIFPLNDKNHSMETRNEETYAVQFANTSRLKNSAILYMQRLLNEDNKIN